MTYRLHFPTDVFDTYKQLPEQARQDLAVCLVDAQEDRLGHSEPHGEDDGVIRTVARGHTSPLSSWSATPPAPPRSSPSPMPVGEGST
ncbi:hypothetical protein GCM10017674_67220 [Streptomyces gardneri]|uniref:Uncharacterized protein n=1 Tax=Streptomyces gardneri TaxID=66892 RepID=A0A4Y3RI29_9ACTN|nr:hypothetical protein SGA01_26390 [Streptomyces gardneri]GHH16832.1 hypothetical protein GCM10017674_67220 [Streptomyces gardneri]